MKKNKKEEIEEKEEVQDFVAQEDEATTTQTEQKEAVPSMTTEEAMAGWQRCMADFDNYRKRQAESAKESQAWAARAIVEDLLPVVDNFHAATDHVPTEQEGSPWVVGMLYIRQQLEKVLADHGVVEIAIAPGDTFDPSIMEAIEEQKRDLAQEGTHNEEKSELRDKEYAAITTVAKIVIRGYKMGDRVIRAARVTIS